MYFLLNRALDWTLVTHVRDSYWTEFLFAFEGIISVETLVIKKQTLLLWSFFFSKFSRYFSITIIATNITNPFQILLKCFWVLFSFYLNQSKWSLLIFTDFISRRNNIKRKEKYLLKSEMVTKSWCWFFNSAWNIMRV